MAEKDSPPEITIVGDTVTISSIMPISAEAIQQWNLHPGNTVSLKFRLDLDARKLAKIIQKQGSPGGSWSIWTDKLVKVLAKQGLKGLATMGVSIQLKQ
jgi:hypothetical protein